MAAEEGLDVAGTYSDENATAYKGNRGPELVKAMEHCEQLVAEHGECTLLIQDPDRLARGDAISARHLLEYALWALKAGVRIRSKQRPEAFTNLVYTALVGEQAHGESKRKSAAVRDGLKRRFAKGLPNGGPRSYGYRFLDHAEGIEVVPEEAEIVRRIGREFLAGRSMAATARDLAADGVKTVKGGQWRQSQITNMLRNPLYAGLVRCGDSLVEGQHEAILDRDTWDRVQALLDARPAQGRGTMPKGNHLFRGGILRCVCGWALIPRTNPGGSEVYRCSGRSARGRDFCEVASLWRADVDGAVFNYFEQIALDAEGTRRELAATQQRQLAEIEALRQSAEREASRAADRFARVKRAFQDDVITAEDWAEQREELIAEREAADAEVQRLHARARAIAAEKGTLDAEHELVERLAEIRRAIAGDVQAAEGVEAVRAALVRLFDAFVVHRSTPERVHVELVGAAFWLEPIVRGDRRGEDGPSGMPRPRREVLGTINTSDGRPVNSPFAPIPVVIGNRGGR